MQSIQALIQFSNVKNRYRYFQKSEKTFGYTQNRIFDLLDTQSKIVFPVSIEKQFLNLNLDENGQFMSETLIDYSDEYKLYVKGPF